MQQVFTGIGIKIQGHLKIVEYKSFEDYLGGRPNQVLLNKRNAVHKDHASVLLTRAITNKNLGAVCFMVFGTGGATLDSTGTVIFNPPNDTDIAADLYKPTYFQMVDDTLGALPGNSMAMRHISNSLFSDCDIRCLIPPNQPFGQLASNTQSGINLNTNEFSFNEIGLKTFDGTLITHVTFSPVLKHAESLLEVIYTLRIFVGQPPPPPPPVEFDLIGVEATTEFTLPIKEYAFPTGADFATAETGTPDFNYRVHGVRLNNSPYFIHVPQSGLNSPQGSLSLWIRATDAFNMSHDLGPALISSAFRNAFEISGRGYIRRNPSAITRANPCQITIPNHGLVDGDQVQFTNVNGGCSELQGLTETITVVDVNNFTIPVDSSGFAAPYTGPALVTFQTANRPEFNTLRIVIRDDDVNPTKTFYWNSSEQIPQGQWVNLLISWDMNHAAGSKILQVFVNDTEWTSTSDPTYVYDPDTAFTIPYTDSRKWIIGEPIVVRTYVQTLQLSREVLRSVA